MEKLKKIIKKNIFIIEFLLCLLEAITFLRILGGKSGWRASINIYNISILVFIVLIILSIIIISLKNSDKKIEKIFLTFAIPIGILYMIFLIPTFVPDENAHALRAYEIANGEFIIKYDESGDAKTYFPLDLIESGTDGGIDNYIALNDKINEEVDYNNKIESFNPSQSYFPILYIFSGFGFFIGKIFNLNFIITMYIGRMFNLIFGLIIGYYSIKLIPFGKLLLCTYMFLPMFFQQEASLSADSFINSIAIFYIVYNLFLMFEKKEFRKKDKLIFVFLSFLLAICKTVYIPLIFISILLFKNKNFEKKDLIKLLTFTFIISIIFGAIWYKFSSGYTDERDYIKIMNVNGGEQVKWIIKNPINFVKTLIHTSIENLDGYINQFIGTPLGWLNINVNGVIIKVLLVILIFTPFLEETNFILTKYDRIWFILLFLGMGFLSALALFIGWTNVGGDKILGIQGRYFIPIAILPLLCLCIKDKNIKFKNIEYTLPIFLSLLNIGAVYSIIDFF